MIESFVFDFVIKAAAVLPRLLLPNPTPPTLPFPVAAAAEDVDDDYY